MPGTGVWGDYVGEGAGSPDPGAMLVVRQLATGGFFLRSCRAPSWEVAGDHGRHVPARAAIAGVRPGDGVDFLGVAWISY